VRERMLPDRPHFGVFGDASESAPRLRARKTAPKPGRCCFVPINRVVQIADRPGVELVLSNPSALAIGARFSAHLGPVLELCGPPTTSRCAPVKLFQPCRSRHRGFWTHRGFERVPLQSRTPHEQEFQNSGRISRRLAIGKIVAQFPGTARYCKGPEQKTVRGMVCD